MMGLTYTFDVWRVTFGVHVPDHYRIKTGVIALPYSGLDPAAERALYRLSDYLVSSVSGGSIWLCPR